LVTPSSYCILAVGDGQKLVTTGQSAYFRNPVKIDHFLGRDLGHYFLGMNKLKQILAVRCLLMVLLRGRSASLLVVNRAPIRIVTADDSQQMKNWVPKNYGTGGCVSKISSPWCKSGFASKDF
jgi:hypothetical protein